MACDVEMQVMLFMRHVRLLWNGGIRKEEVWVSMITYLYWH